MIDFSLTSDDKKKFLSPFEMFYIAFNWLQKSEWIWKMNYSLPINSIDLARNNLTLSNSEDKKLTYHSKKKGNSHDKIISQVFYFIKVEFEYHDINQNLKE